MQDDSCIQRYGLYFVYKSVQLDETEGGCALDLVWQAIGVLGRHTVGTRVHGHRKHRFARYVVVLHIDVVKPIRKPLTRISAFFCRLGSFIGTLFFFSFRE